jgi:succinate-semialdehyde dehydrogenase/glutarate-semialdehyde dehydrogenase
MGVDMRHEVAAALPFGRTRRLAGLVTAAAGRPRNVTRAPFDGSVVGDVPSCTAEDVATAVRRARAAQQEWAARPVDQRAAVLLRYHDLVLARQAEILDVVQVETGKSRTGALEEVLDVAVTARYYARSARRHLRSRRRQGAIPGATVTVEHQQPLGVVGVICPWNYPLTLAISDALPALVAGNAVVLKPDSQTPFCALIAVDLLREAGLPSDLLAVVTGEGEVLGPPLIDEVDYLMFTGSSETGRIVGEQCARRLIGYSAELGGKNPMVVLADCDVDRTVDGAWRACFGNAGQLCISIERMYVEDAVYDRFVPAFVERVAAIRLGAGFDWDVEMGSLMSPQQVQRVQQYVDDAVAKGARVLTGGRHRPDIGPLFYEPTVLEGVDEGMAVMREETFGPVVAVQRVRDADEAIAHANDSPFGLNASIWGSPNRAAALATRLQAGTVNVNAGYVSAWGSHDAPMGGMKDSGLGRRHGVQGIQKYCESQTVAVQRLVPIAPFAGMSNETYARLMTAGARLLRRLPGIE